ncbi:MAG: hypothetical protein JNJ73_06350 [Hyphomonadaceae bacterium]|nr:hypothetical protein [Hyphomonadaceae bacterium]
MEDNVTPFRPRRPQRPAPKRTDPLKSHRGKVIIVHSLTLAAFAIYLFTGPPITFVGLAFGIAAIAIASSNRREGMPWATTHHEQALRTIVIGAAVWTLGSLLAFFPGMSSVAFGISIVVAIWVLVRAGVGLVLAALRKPVLNARGMLL